MADAERVSAVREVWPLLVVRDIEASVRFYRDALGFRVEGRAESDGGLFWCRVSRGGASVMLQQWDPEDGLIDGRGRGVTLYVLCDDVDLLYSELLSRKLRLDPPRTESYGMRQLFVPEPDGYALCFESEIVAEPVTALAPP
jgi:catechol 2,3-dioxygenase-like lactoylglutathione lyase family enzyme